jgi:hypothetical protein
MAENGRLAELSPLEGDDRLFAAIVSGCHIENAARVAGISQRTAYRRLSDPAFRSQVQSARQDLRESILARLADAGHDAISSLWGLLQSDDESIRLKAAKVLLDSLLSNNRTDQPEPQGKRFRAAVMVESN